MLFRKTNLLLLYTKVKRYGKQNPAIWFVFRPLWHYSPHLRGQTIRNQCKTTFAAYTKWAKADVEFLRCHSADLLQYLEELEPVLHLGSRIRERRHHHCCTGSTAFSNRRRERQYRSSEGSDEQTPWNRKITGNCNKLAQTGAAHLPINMCIPRKWFKLTSSSCPPIGSEMHF